MAITRKAIREKIGADSNLTDDDVKALLDLIHAEVDSVRDDRDAIKAELEKANAALATEKTAREKAESDLTTFKTETENKATRSAKESAYKALLKSTGVSDKRINSIAKLADIDSITLNADGTIKDAAKLSESIKAEWSDFITTQGVQGASVPTPPASDSGKTAFNAMSLSEKMAFANSHPEEFRAYTAK